MKAGKIVKKEYNNVGWKYQKDYHHLQDYTLIKCIEREARKI